MAGKLPVRCSIPVPVVAVAAEGMRLRPGPNQEGKWVEIESPAEFSWLVEGQEYNLRGHINEHGEDNGTIEE